MSGPAPSEEGARVAGRIGFIFRPDSHKSAALFTELAPWLITRGHTPVVVAEDIAGDAYIEAYQARGVERVARAAFGKSIVLAVALGGDGTMLSAAATVAADGVPVLGINLGRLGFLAPFDPSEAQSALSAALAGTLRKSRRMRLQTTYHPAVGEPVTHIALNDVVIHQGSTARLISLEARLDDELVATYRADGLIVASPAGSTAYNLAAGGPIIVPGYGAMVLTPICAHTLNSRPLVVPAESTLSLRLDEWSRDVVFTMDGRWGSAFGYGDRVDITAAPTPLVLFASNKPYFDIMREKLHWGVRADKGPSED